MARTIYPLDQEPPKDLTGHFHLNYYNDTLLIPQATGRTHHTSGSCLLQ